MAMPSGDGHLVHLYGSDEASTGSVLNVHTDTQAKGIAIYAETTGEEATGLMVYSAGGVAAENASVVIDKGDTGDGSALIAMGSGIGSLAFITDLASASVPSLNNYGLEVNTGETGDASIFVTNTYEDGNALEAHGNVKIMGDGVTTETTEPMLLIADDPENAYPAFDGSLVHIFSSTPSTVGSAMLIHTDTEVQGIGLHVETANENATALLVVSDGGVAAENATAIFDKGIGGLGSAVIAQGDGVGSLVFINDLMTDSYAASQDDYGLEVRTGESANASVYLSNEHVDGDEIADGTALKIGQGKVVLANATATDATIGDMGAYSVISYTSDTDQILNLSDLPTGENGQILYIINDTVDILNFGLLQIEVGDMIMVIWYGGAWHSLNDSTPQ
jgi:hypothetical protein